MSQYPPYPPGPYNGYGQYHGQPPPQPPPQSPYGYQHPPPNFSVPPPPINAPPPFNAGAPMYPPPGQPGIGMDTNRNMSQGAFDYNSMQIPGLGIGGPPATSMPFGVPPIPTPWGQPPPHFNHQPPPMMPQQPTQPPAPRPFGGFNSGPSQPAAAAAAAAAANAGPGNRPANLPPKLPPKPPVRVTKQIEIEEGELDEGQFEDLYEPAPPITVNTNVKNAPSKPAPAPVESQPTSAVDTPDANFYGNDEDEGEVTAKDGQNGVPAAERERTGSYSPFLSPREVESEDVTPQNGDRRLQAPQSVPDRTKATGNSNGRAPLLPGLQFTSSSFSNSVTQNKTEQVAPAPQPAPVPSSAPKTLQTVQKEAQLAILRLLPLGVKYQNYIEEGIDEEVVKKLYNNLHLDIPKPASETTTATTSTQKAAPEKVSSPVPTSPQTAKVQQQQPTLVVAETTSTTEQPSKEESRKDRIARLMAAKAEKAAKPATATVPNPPSVPAAKPAPAPAAMAQPSPFVSEAKGVQAATQDKPVGDAAAPKPKLGPKELLLQQKIAALQKSREAQKQVQANMKPQAASPSLAGTNAPSPNPMAPAGLNNGFAQAQSLSNVPATVPTIPGLQFPGTSNAQPAPAMNPRKRPVAADFVEFSSTVANPPKRPFGQIRKETSLVIDVTDGSDDEDMDIEMDMESPTDVPQPTQTVNGPFLRGGLRDFPPLTDTLPPRQFLSPVPGAQGANPPTTSQNIRRRETELDVKERMIQEMRRKIAEAEAKRKAKKSSVGSQTPTQPEQTPELKDDGGFRLPTTRQSASISSPGPSSITTPVRPASAAPVLSSPSLSDPSKPSPAAKAALEAKMNRLRQLREEQARLEAEISGFSEEPEQSDTTSVEVPAQSSLSNKDAASVPTQPSAELENDHEALKESSAIINEEIQPKEPSSVPAPAPESQEAAGIAETAEQDDETSAMSLDEGEASESDHEEQPTGVAEGVQPSQQAGEIGGGHSEAPREDTPAKLDETSPMDIESSPSSPTSLESSPEDKTPLPDQISVVAQPREAVQELEEEPLKDVNVVSSERAGPVQLTRSQGTHEATATKPSSFRPYESPLRYFHAYRFHPNYQETVPGGLRSLTYSNRINPSTPLCPSELAGQQCNETTCEFQHFKSIVAPDDNILLELGKADEFEGEQKTRFIDGLRKLLQEFRAKKVKDFESIARGIIEYRARFLGDRSKVLPLEGVTL